MNTTKDKSKYWVDLKDNSQTVSTSWADPRRFYCDVGHIVPLVNSIKPISIRDIACGNGRHIKVLLEFFDHFKSVELWDFNSTYIKKLKRYYSEQSHINAYELDISDKECHFPPGSDLDLCFGSLHYILKDDSLKVFFGRMASTSFIRVPCSFENRIEVNTFSEDLQAPYQATYRTVEEYIKLLSLHYDVIEWKYAYDASFDSLHNTRQIYILCQKEKIVSLESLEEWGHWLV